MWGERLRTCATLRSIAPAMESPRWPLASLASAARADEPGSGRVSPARSRASSDALCARTVKLPRWPLAWLASAAATTHDERAKDRGPYMRTVRLALRHPGLTLALAALLLVAVQVAYGKFGRGVEFFPKVEPDYGQVVVHARGNLALDEKTRLVGEVEKRVLAFDGLKTVYTRVGEQPRGMSELTEDTIGVILFEFADWRSRPPAHEIMDAIRAKTADIAGILIEVTAPRAGPPTGKPIQVQLAALDPADLPAAAGKVAAILAARSDIRDLDDGQPLPGIDWKIEVDKSAAAKYGAGIAAVGSSVQLVTNGLKAT